MEELLIAEGGAVKALGDGRVGGYLVLYGSPEQTDLVGDYFDADTDFGLADESLVFYHHGLDPTIGPRQIGVGKMRRDPVGVWIEAQLALRDAYERGIYELAEQGKLGLSSGTAPHLVIRERAGKAWRIARWPLGLDASLTPTPAEPRTNVTALKTLRVDLRIPAARQEPDGSAETDKNQPINKESTMEDKDTAPAPAPAPTPTSPPSPAADALETMIANLNKAMSEIKADLSQLTREAPQPATGVAQIIAAGQASGKMTRESYAEEQLNALKAFLRREIGAKEWAEHNQRLAQQPDVQRAAKAWSALVRDPLSAHAWQEYANAQKVTMVESVASLGGALVPVLYGNQLVGTLTEQSILRRSGAYQFPVVGTNSFRVPTITRSGSAPLVSELAIAPQTEPTFGEIAFTAFGYRAQYIASWEQMADTRIPLDSMLMDNAAWQFVQSENIHLGAGTGAGQPQGVAQATVGVSAGSTLSLLDGDDIIDLYHSVPYQYRDNCVWYMHDQIARHVRRLRDNSGSGAGTGNYLWQPGLQAGQPDTLLGRPVFTLNSMASSGSAANLIVFGDPRFFWVADFNSGQTEFMILRELYAASGAIGWTFFRRFDSRIMVPEAFRGLRLV